MRDQSARAAVEHRIVRRQAFRDVVRVEDRAFVAAVRPFAPIIAMYIHEIGRIAAEPYGAAETAPMPLASR